MHDTDSPSVAEQKAKPASIMDSTSSTNTKETQPAAGEDSTHSPARSSTVSTPAEDVVPAAADPEAPPPAETELKDFEHEPLGKRLLVMLALCMAVFLAALDVTIVTTAIPTIVEQLDSASGYVWIGSVFTLANAASVPTWGKISEIFGRKPVLLAANVIFLIGSLVSALAKNINMLIAGRAVQGLGAGGLVILVNITIADLFSLRNRGAYYGMIGGVWALASAIGPVIGGVFTEEVTWRWNFYINLPFDGIAFIIIFLFLKLNTPKTPLWDGLKAIDWVGSLLVVGGTLMLLFGLVYGGSSHPWDSAIVLCLIIFGVFTWVLFILWEWKLAKYQIIPVQIFKQRSVAATYICVFIHGFVFIASSYYLPLYFQACLGKTPLLSGVYLLPNCAALSISSITVGIYIRKTGRYLECMYAGFLLMTLGYGLLINLDAESSLAKIMIYQLIAGLGIGPLFQSPIIALQSHVKPREIALATSTLGFVRQLSTSISVVVGSVVYESQMAKYKDALIAALGETLGSEIGGSGAGAEAEVIRTLTEPGRTIAENAYGNSLSKMWILYTAMAAVGLIFVPLIRQKVLSRDFAEAKTGLAAEEEKAAERKQELAEKQERKRLKAGGAPAAAESGLQEKV